MRWMVGGQDLLKRRRMFLVYFQYPMDEILFRLELLMVHQEWDNDVYVYSNIKSVMLLSWRFCVLCW